ncbi:MAG TPA: hypothetical protein VFL47_02180, partial [Flavisolibacter sp.]|nr:hypothetical protein [Flavisolibacter sp.]
WAAFSGLPQRGFTVDRHSLLMIGSGFVVLVGVLLIVSVLISDLGLVGGTSDPIASKPVMPQLAQTDAVSQVASAAAKNVSHTVTAMDVETSEPKPLPATEHAPLVEEKPKDAPMKPPVRDETPKTAAVSQKVGNTTATRSNSAIVTKNVKIKSKTEPEGIFAGKKIPSITDKTAGATRPRIVKDPRP